MDVATQQRIEDVIVEELHAGHRDEAEHKWSYVRSQGGDIASLESLEAIAQTRGTIERLPQQQTAMMPKPKNASWAEVRRSLVVGLYVVWWLIRAVALWFFMVFSLIVIAKETGVGFLDEHAGPIALVLLIGGWVWRDQRRRRAGSTPPTPR